MIPSCYLVSYQAFNGEWVPSGVYGSLESARKEYPEIPLDYQTGEKVFVTETEMRSIETLPYRA